MGNAPVTGALAMRVWREPLLPASFDAHSRSTPVTFQPPTYELNACAVFLTETAGIGHNIHLCCYGFRHAAAPSY